MYNATRRLTTLVAWDKEWIHFGTDNQVNFDLVQKLIEDHLNDKEVWLIQGRTTSGQVKKEEIGETIKYILGKGDFQIWTPRLDKVIQFNRIGVFNIGRR